MEDLDNKHWAQSYLIDPLTMPAPNEETGPGSHFYVSPTPKMEASSPQLNKNKSNTAKAESLGKQSRNSPSSPPVSFSPGMKNTHDASTSSMTGNGTPTTPTTSTNPFRRRPIQATSSGDSSSVNRSGLLTPPPSGSDLKSKPSRLDYSGSPKPLSTSNALQHATSSKSLNSPNPSFSASYNNSRNSNGRRPYRRHTPPSPLMQSWEPDKDVNVKPVKREKRRETFSHSSNPYHDKSASLDKGKHSMRADPGRTRSYSLTSRHPDDEASSRRSHHSRSRNSARPRPDVIDRLDLSGPTMNYRGKVAVYHHEGPYDAALPTSNRYEKYSPLAALKDSNMETLKATPPEKILDAVQSHRPLDGVATIPSGCMDMFGREYEYEEGADMMVDGLPNGEAYKRWDGVNYLPGDIKGKGEGWYNQDPENVNRDRGFHFKMFKGHNHHHSPHRRNVSGPPACGKTTGYEAIEMTSGVKDRAAANGSRSNGAARPATLRRNSTGTSRVLTTSSSGNRGNKERSTPPTSMPSTVVKSGAAVNDSDASLKRFNSTGRRVGEGLRRRFGSMRKRRDREIEAQS